MGKKAKKESKEKAPKIDPKKLRKAADELQELLDLEDDDGNPVELNKGSIDEIVEKVKEAAGELTSDDEISETLAGVLEILGVEIPEADADDADDADDESEGEESEEDVEDDEDADDEEEDDDAEDDAPELSLADQVKAAKKLDDMKVLVNNNDEFKKLRKGLGEYKGLAGPRELKAKMFKILGVEAALTPAKKEKTENKMTRIDAVIQTIKEGKTTDPEKIVPKANTLYAANGGKDNLKESVWATTLVLKVVSALGVTFK